MKLSTKEPLLATFETNNRREAVLFGENIWQWRAQSYINSKSFNQFDDFIGKLVQYLASNKRGSRLDLEYESFYNGSTNVIIKAQFFDKNYQFDSRESLSIILKDDILGDEKVFPLILKNNNYQTFSIAADRIKSFRQYGESLENLAIDYPEYSKNLKVRKTANLQIKP